MAELVGIPKTTPYIGLLHELGMWTMEGRIQYRKLMLYHNIINSDKRRLAKRVIEEEKERMTEGSFYNETYKIIDELRIEEIESKKKEDAKKVIKEKINEKMVSMIEEEKENKTKLRFLKSPINFKRQQYITELPGDDAVKVMKIRLNMVDVGHNYKGNRRKPRTCCYCQINEDTTEHLVQCKRNNGVDVKEFENAESKHWKEIISQVDENINSRDKTLNS